ncbi:lipopolysaccharide biosynthesis protein [Megasphaera sp.]|uniref:lipopolysaccharide biosynthesis protein n=1 Tax=Megasphaera sp. TaxID=2023260 RepID=UPI0040298CC3
MVSTGIVVTNFIWKFAERCGAQFISFVVSIILARILMPSDYGVIALCMVFIYILQVFADSGLGTALIQKKSPDNLDYSTVFFTNIFISLVLYFWMWIGAPYIADFYAMPELVSLVRVLSLILISNGLRNVQQAYVSKHMIFKRFFYSTLGASISSTIVGIGLAYHGFGIWSLVAQQLFNGYVGTLILWLTVPWRPSFTFSFIRLKKLFAFGWKLLVSALISTGYDQLWQLIIGKVYSPSDLAYFNQGQKFPQVIVTNINASIDSILLPTMSSEQEHRDRVRDMTRRAIKTSIFIMAPLMIILAACSDNIVTLVLTEKWLPCVPFLCIFCINYMFWPVHTANLNAINALGRSDIFLKLEIIKNVIGISIVLYTMQYSVMAMAYGTLVSGVCSQIINAWPNKKLLHYGYFQQVRDFIPSIFLAAAAGCVAYIIGFLALPLVGLLILQGVTGLMIYFILAYIIKIDACLYLVNMARRII